MKKKRNIQKLKVHKETISNLNTITGGDVGTSGFRTLIIIKSAVFVSCREGCTDFCNNGQG